MTVKKSEQIDDAVVKELKRAFIRLYNAFSAINLCKGGSVGQARQKALERMSAVVKAKTRKDNYLNDCLTKIEAENKKEMLEYIKHSNMSDKFFTDDVALWQFRKSAVREFISSAKYFNDVYNKFYIDKNILPNVAVNSSDNQRS